MLDRLNALLAGDVNASEATLVDRVLRGVTAAVDRLTGRRVVMAQSCGGTCTFEYSSCPNETWVAHYSCSGVACSSLGSDCTV